ncbi:hypothetical protein BS50DRAFT_579267 [Corynespora cassiicola Philippines]|uniref:Uncharacterized protein n=1 Tax=Corynespora cassiicola Philippines TaxID=1448308 RepID=A0A2T2N4P5_CORCC|nr:hypothetical protein BS50DRAFT_579267 [Corynespora cassiicola Philippines]
MHVQSSIRTAPVANIRFHATLQAHPPLSACISPSSPSPASAPTWEAAPGENLCRSASAKPPKSHPARHVTIGQPPPLLSYP